MKDNEKAALVIIMLMLPFFILLLSGLTGLTLQLGGNQVLSSYSWSGGGANYVSGVNCVSPYANGVFSTPPSPSFCNWQNGGFSNTSPSSFSVNTGGQTFTNQLGRLQSAMAPYSIG